MEHTQRPSGDAEAPLADPESGLTEIPLADSIDPELLFDDGLPRPNQNGGFKGATAARAAGISYRQLDYWARTGLVEPTVQSAKGSGSQRLYGFRDILVLKLVKRLLDTGISLQQIRTAVGQLHEAGVHDLSQTTLMSDGASVYLCTSNDEVIDLVSRGQGVFGIAVGKVLREVETSLVDMDEHRETPESSLDELAARRSSRKIS
ncbi:MerR family transcriptional regulator [Leucobacter rhizosphaerae]|uniref:MerR family transcriptional regulator n=1 Tax=Leucobacter rhizosphaerae TaxID=2932245 RepID=A0ABY4FYD8_9MICO|nr:MerR family transcriptional regulator [Leucobacter rhizosphaerae]UOQ61124.1 MerR family transcriptional regulator [Leucobacter rhizosphaerae]